MQVIERKLQHTKDKVIKQLQISEQEYAQYQYEQGLEFLERYIPSDPAGIDFLQRSKTYWQWWKNHWFIRDRRFLLLFPTGPAKTLNHSYRQLHAAKYLISDIYPPAVVLGNDYAKMIGEVNNEIKL